MSEYTRRQELDEKFSVGVEEKLDPLAAHVEAYRAVDADPLEWAYETIRERGDFKAKTLTEYRNVFRQWEEHMEREGRHVDCPNEQHVIRFIEWLLRPESERGRGNAPRTVRGKLSKLNKAYKIWQKKRAYPEDYNPIEGAREEKKADLRGVTKKEHRKVPVSELRELLADVTNLRDRAVIGIQLKLGLRAGEVSNIKLSDMHLADRDLQRHFPEMGTHRKVMDRPNSIIIPDRDERAGNKSECYRVMPLDDEMRRLLKRYLLVRPDAGEPWLFLSDTSHSKLGTAYVNAIWKSAFHPEYAETDEYRGVTSHFGRHRFTTYWRVECDVNRELVKYMRGDAVDEEAKSREAIDVYLHTYFEDIEELYLDNIYRLL